MMARPLPTGFGAHYNLPDFAKYPNFSVKISRGAAAPIPHVDG
jgi:hypothetical protein